MRKLHLSLLAAAAVVFPLNLLAQDTGDQQAWTYAQCIEYARAHNIQLQLSQLQNQSASYTLEGSKAKWEPSLSFSTTQGLTNQPFSDGNKNAYASQYGLSAGWTVWNGGERESTIKRDELNVQISAFNSDDIRRNLETEILQIYINILYSREAIVINEQAAEVSAAQADRARQLMEAGRLSRVDYTQLEAQAQQDRYAIVSAKATYANNCMSLKRLLQLGLNQGITAAEVDFTEEQVLATLPAMEESYQLAMDTDAAFAANKLSVETSALEVKIAKASGLPDISLNAGVSTGYMAPGSSFGDQMKKGFGENIGLTLSIPILNNKRTKVAVAQAEVNRLNAELNIASRQNEIAQTIEGLYIDLNSAQARYISGKEQVKSTSLSAELVGEQFKLGLVNTVELLTAHTNALRAQIELLQAKYMCMIDQKLVEFYRNGYVTL